MRIMAVSLDKPRHLRWLMAVRAVVAATLLLSAFAINLILSPTASLAPFYMLAAASFLLVLVYAILFKRGQNHTWFAVIQVAGDVAVITGFVYASGGVHSPMSFLYLLPTITAAVLLPSWGAFLAAGFAWFCYTGLVLSTIAGIVPDYPPGIAAGVEISSSFLWYSLVSHLAGFLFAALLSTNLAERLRRTGEELEERHSDLAELQALNENIVESITSGLMTTDLRGRITFVNPAGCEITGMDPTELMNRDVKELFGLEEGFLHQVRGILGEERRYRFEKWCAPQGGEKRFLGMAASVLRDRTSRPLGLIFTFQDLTEIQALENEVRMKERMAALGEMAAGLAHELRNPLASITGSVQVLSGEMNGPAGDVEQTDLMEIILRESERLDQAIRDFLVFARPGPFSPERTDLVRLIGDSVRLLRNSREFRPGHRIETVFPAPEVTCEIDANRAKQVFWNLATNALKSMPDRGTLTIRVDVGREGRARIVFADQGVGMDQDQLDRYFQPFQGGFRDGTGLGAAIVYRIIQEHRGTINVSSVKGKGTEVTVTLPITSQLRASPMQTARA
jgi:two-component system sensor histidine kinase PilS (NtrC family)